MDGNTEERAKICANAHDNTDDRGHTMKSAGGPVVNNLRQLQAQRGSSQRNEDFNPQSAMLGIAFDFRSWLALERDSHHQQQSKRQDLLMLSLAVIGLLLLTIAANNSGTFRTQDNLSSSELSNSVH